jgi:hypothetical protein
VYIAVVRVFNFDKLSSFTVYSALRIRLSIPELSGNSNLDISVLRAKFWAGCSRKGSDRFEKAKYWAQGLSRRNEESPRIFRR